MKFLLDTCVISELVRTMPDSKVMAWFEHQDELALGISVLTLGEIRKGISKLASGSKKDRLAQWLDQLAERFEQRILPIDTAIAMKWGELSDICDFKATPLPVIDGLLAATAICHHLKIVTRSVSDMEKTGVQMVNPWLL